jgi:hypothetical protein
MLFNARKMQDMFFGQRSKGIIVCVDDPVVGVGMLPEEGAGIFAAIVGH